MRHIAVICPLMKSLPDRIKALRARLNLTQAEFAARYQINLRSLQQWEIGRFLPPLAEWAITVIEDDPERIARVFTRE